MPTNSSATVMPASRTTRRPDLATELRVLILRLSRRIRTESNPADVSESQYCVLSGLTLNGPMTPRALAERDHVQPPTMTRTIATLEAAGHVTRSSHPSDGRQVLIELTPSGASLVRETRKRRNVWMAERLKGITAEEREVLTQAVRILERMATD
ncbi:MarR family transcriptional regulator [Georgenia sp. MJ206]|uniref:MarR family winged helix-turn-helix transcriptional regulator n=1 Tax=Georgenia wangjunii TaxID=3117730 RepID=UPI002F263FB3